MFLSIGLIAADCISLGLQVLKSLLTTGPCSGENYEATPDDSDVGLPKGIRGLVAGDDNPMLLIADLNQALGDVGIVLGMITTQESLRILYFTYTSLCVCSGECLVHSPSRGLT